MVSAMRVQKLGRRAVAEGVGTFLFVLVGTGAIMVDARTDGGLGAVGIALAFAFALACMVYAIGHLSGSHVNPAVTIGLWAVRRFPAKDALVYVGAQCVGAVAASLFLWGILGDVANVGATIPDVAPSEAFALEWVLSFALMFVIAAVASDERVAYGSVGLAVGFAYGFGVLFGLPLTGASMNPARSLGPAVAVDVWAAHWVYWLAPIFGMIAAAWTYETLRAARSPDLRLRRPTLFGVGGEIGESPAPPGSEERRSGARGRRSGVDRRKKDVGPPPGVPERRSGEDRRSGRERREKRPGLPPDEPDGETRGA